jgi:hypothetical protein
MTTTCYGNIWKYADGLDSAIPKRESLKMPVSSTVTNQFEAELHEGDHKLLRVANGAHSGALQSHAGLTEAAGNFPDGWEELQSEDKLGCARGVVWSLVFEAALVIAAAIYWKVRFAR